MLGSALAAGAALIALETGSAAADMIDTSGLAPWEVCGECHGLEGLSPMPRFPRLAGQPAAYLEKQIRDFRSGARSNDGGQMRTVVTEIATEEVRPIAAYFAALPGPSNTRNGPTPAEAALARPLVEEGRDGARLPACRSCHGAGVPVDPPAPYLEGQHRAYLAKQLRDFRSGARANDPAGLMTEVARRLDDAEIEALATYLAAEPRQGGPQQPHHNDAPLTDGGSDDVPTTKHSVLSDR